MTRSIDQVRASIGHPVLDADGHYIEFWPVLADYIRAQGVEPDPQRMAVSYRRFEPETLAERCRTRTVQSSWWSVPAENTDDHATALLPTLLHERLPEIGIDFAVMFPTMGLSFGHIADAELRRAACRGLNQYVTDVFAGLRDRLEPAAVVPMGTPEEAIAELDHAVHDLGFKTVLIPSFMERPVEAARHACGDHPEVARYATWMDFYGIDSAYDYDPFWARCVELGVSVSGHSFSFGTGTRRSISNYMYNHLGNFAAAGEALCKALFLGGVTRRFPALRIALLEGGVSWAAQLYVDLIGHWKKRNGSAVLRYDPDRLDRVRLEALVAKYGSYLGDHTLGGYRSAGYTERERPERLDEFDACGITTVDDIARLLVPSFAFGCEADDPLVATAFDTRVNPGGVTLRAVFSSDIGHWDVPDIAELLAEVHEPVEEGWLTEEQFRAFVFEHAVRFHTDANPNFFNGTAVEAAARELVRAVRS
jgi:predicted TIM-barrel fold metal-dependent hydrolase